MKTIPYEPVEGVDRVTIAADELIVVEGRTEVAADLAPILDLHPSLKRAPKKPSGDTGATTTPKES